jgi:PIN domain nuclease of toxin-antitoxin system
MFWSAASTWEIGIKVKTGRLELPVSLADFAARVLLTVQSLDVRHAHAVMAADLPLHHRDPFDRMLVAQALVEGMTLVSSDPLLSLYEAPVLWS